jgi:predicted enzyme related to lactoylglutathione lyase
MKIVLTSIFVEDQDKALRFYTEVLGFIKKREIPMGPYKWLTVISPEGPDDVELLLEPNNNPAARTFQEAMHSQKIPMMTFQVKDLQAEQDRLQKLGVEFVAGPADAGPVRYADFEDTCGNLVKIFQVK